MCLTLVTSKIAMKYLRQCNSLLPLKAVVLFLITPGSVTSSKQALAFMPPLKWTGSAHGAIQKLKRGEKNGLFSSHLMRWISSAKRSDKRKLEWRGAVMGTTLSCSSEVSNWARMKPYVQAFCSIYWSLYIPGSGPYDHTVHVHT